MSDVILAFMPKFLGNSQNFIQLIFQIVMGCGSSKSGKHRQMRYSDGDVPAAPRSSLETTKRPVVGIGQPLGGTKKEVDARQAQLEAAEKRAVAYANRGLTGNQKGQELSDSAKKQELIGKINAAYQV